LDNAITKKFLNLGLNAGESLFARMRSLVGKPICEPTEIIQPISKEQMVFEV
jgi:hypothetical protein